MNILRQLSIYFVILISRSTAWEMFKCKNGFSLFSMRFDDEYLEKLPSVQPYYRCNGENDCSDGSDEDDCPTDPVEICNIRQMFMCNGTNKCVLGRCDGRQNCPDLSDELNCPCEELGKFKCKDSGLCIGLLLRCDGVQDCEDNSDEENCISEPFKCRKPLREFACANGDRCIKQMYKSDNSVDCEDRSDEKYRPYFVFLDGTPDLSFNNCEDKYRCSDGACLWEKRWCDGLEDCRDGGDEIYCDYRNLTSVKKITVRISDVIMLVNNRSSILAHNLQTNESKPILSGLNSSFAMDFDFASKRIFWTDVNEDKIMMCNVGDEVSMENCKDSMEVLVSSGLHSPEGLAFDWIRSLLFWTDAGLDKINVIDLKTRSTTTLITYHLMQPTSIAVDPELGLIFYISEKDMSIYRAGMNGKDIEKIVKKHKYESDYFDWLTGLTLDVRSKEIYWIEVKSRKIRRSDYWGNKKEIVIESKRFVHHPLSLNSLDETIYYSNRNNNTIYAINQEGYKNDLNIQLITNITAPRTLRLFSSEIQPSFPNRCPEDACGARICLPSGAYKNGQRYEKFIRKMGRSFSCDNDL